MVEPLTLPRVVAPVAPGNRIQPAKANEDRNRNFAFSKQLNKERRRNAPPDEEGAEENAKGAPPETGAPPDPTVTGGVRIDESEDGETQIKLIDIRV